MGIRIAHDSFFSEIDYKYVTEWINGIALVRGYGENITSKGMSINSATEIGALEDGVV